MLICARVLNVLMLLLGVSLALLGAGTALLAGARLGATSGTGWDGVVVVLGLAAALPGVWLAGCAGAAAARWRRRPSTAVLLAALGPGLLGGMLLFSGLVGGLGVVALPFAALFLALTVVPASAYAGLETPVRLGPLP
ncbi:hypothetical protein [Nocardioides sambongensis]|uniref:hypothetical protein n=1 Tax=Nocardioides sambongensis TaxID=2589074 RepID=UPI00112AD29B|nr:hypothetical protein [Nocardioides sambongensis]